MTSNGWTIRWGLGVASVVIGAALLTVFIQTGITTVSSSDIGLYRWWGESVAGGALPYRQIPIEYPPGAVPLFVIPAMASGSISTYLIAFAAGMALAGIGGILLATRVGAGEGPPSRAWVMRTIGAGAMVGVLASVALARFDLVPTGLMIGALYAVASNRLSSAGVLLGAGVAVKVFPAVMIPVVLAHIVRRRGWRAVTAFMAPMAVVVAMAFLPFVIFAAEGIEHSFSVQLSRPVEIESIAASVLWVGRAAGLVTWPHQPSYFNLAFVEADRAAVASTVIGVGVLCYIWLEHARSDGSTRMLSWASFASVATFVVFAKVLSPQFLLWLIAMIPALRGGRANVTTGLVGGAALLTALYFPRWFPAVGNELDTWWLSVIAVRNALLLAMLLVVIIDMRRRPDAPAR